MYYKNSQNLLHHLWLRESNIYRGIRHPVPSHFLYHERNFYKSITPRLTVQNVEKPYGYLRKFTPDGRLLLAFSLDQKSLVVYMYQGIGSAASLLRPEENECISSEDNTLLSLHIRQSLFDVLFVRVHDIPLITTPTIAKHIVNREFSLFVDNGRYVILASIAGGSIFPNYLDNHDYSDLFDEADLYDFTFYLVDLREGCIADTFRLEHDYVVLSHHHSVSLYDRTMAILSSYRQCIELYEVNVTDGKFKRLLILGPYGSELDRERVLAHLQQINYTLDPEELMPLSHLKQKILAYAYRTVMNTNCLLERQEKLKEFYKSYPLLENMIVLKMQLIDNDNILLRYENRQIQEPVEMGLHRAGHQNFKVYIFYNITEQKILKIFPENSIELVLVVRNHSDDFRNVRSLQIPWHASSPSNNYFFQAAFDNAFMTYEEGLAAATARFNSSLPICSQSFSTSPYLDYSLFKYEDRNVSPLERPRIHSAEALRFHDRRTGNLLYRAYLIQPIAYENAAILNSPRDLTSFIFHPYEPFFISTQKFLSYYNINFHMYNSYTKVKA